MFLIYLTLYLLLGFFTFLAARALWYVSMEYSGCRPVTIGTCFMGLMMMWIGPLILIYLIVGGLVYLVETRQRQIERFMSIEIGNPCRWIKRAWTSIS